MHQIGAIFYVAWGLLHFYAAFQVYKLGARQMAGMARGRIYQNAWNLAFFAVAVAVVAVSYNWIDNPLGYWLNLVMTSVQTLVSFCLPWRPVICLVARATGSGPVDRGSELQHPGAVRGASLSRRQEIIYAESNHKPKGE